MASKQYAYYIEGNQIAIVEKDVSFDNNLNNKDYGPGVSRQRWESPQSSVTDGLEVKYVYAPIWRYNDKTTFISTITGYLEYTGQLRLASSAEFPTAGITHIVITGSNKWNGLHEVDTLHSDSLMTLKTRYDDGAAGTTTESSTLYWDVDLLEDEDFTLDLPNYLQKALVYYVKAKLAEDGGDFKLREYAMREFKKMIEKHENSRISGLRIVAPSSHAIR